MSSRRARHTRVFTATSELSVNTATSASDRPSMTASANAMRVRIAIDDLVLDDFEVDRGRLAACDREVRSTGCDRLAPAGQRAVAAERWQGPEDLQERVLDQIFDVAVGAQDPVQGVVNTRLLRME